jgi:phosphatidate cytidylyltransferase
MLRQRIITAIIIAPIALVCVFLLPPFEFSLFVGAVLTVAAWEWANFAKVPSAIRYLYAGLLALAMAASSFLPQAAVLGVSLLWWLVAFVLVIRYPALVPLWQSKAVILVLGFIVLVPGWTALTLLKGLPDSSFFLCLLFFLIWGADIGAYFTGRAFGKHKLAPRVSPGKTWEGVGGGILASFIIAILMATYLGRPALLDADGVIFLAVCLLIAGVSVLGDLAISMFKRHRDIKDSSGLLPGHGGFLDRIDSLLAAGPAVALYLLLAGWV